jgi:hypothetical protein
MQLKIGAGNEKPCLRSNENNIEPALISGEREKRLKRESEKHVVKAKKAKKPKKTKPEENNRA